VEKYYQISCIEAGISKTIDNNNNSNYDVRKKPINCYTCNKFETHSKLWTLVQQTLVYVEKWQRYSRCPDPDDGRKLYL